MGGGRWVVRGARRAVVGAAFADLISNQRGAAAIWQFLPTEVPEGVADSERSAMQKIQSFRDLEVWQLGMSLIVLTYRATECFPSDERFGITSQMRRAAVSIPSNVAEGKARQTDGAFLNHVRIALGSQAELLTLIEAGLRLGYLKADGAAALVERVDEVRRLLHGLRRSLESRQASLQSAVTLIVWACAGALLL